MLTWRHPDKMTPRFFGWINDAAHDSGQYPRITSDWRDPAANANASGSSTTSRHLYGEAVDFDIPRTGHGAIVGPLVVALIRRAEAMGVTNEIEIELVASAKDSHLHLALDPSQKVPMIFGATD